MISMIEHSCVEEKHWITHEELMDITVIAESTPGPIAINCATFTGYKQAGLAGAFAATFGIVVPPFLVILAASLFLYDFFTWKLLAAAFQGIKIAVGLLILEAAMMMLRKGSRTWLSRGIPPGFLFGHALQRYLWPADFFHPADAPGSRNQSGIFQAAGAIPSRRWWRKMIYLDLFAGFLKVGCFAFGGAYGAIPLIRDVVLSYGWLNDDMLTYMIAVSESTPGPIMVNLATYVGSSQGGFLGAITATAAVVLPSFLIIILVTAILHHLLDNRYIQSLLRGMKPCVTGIVLATGLYMTFQHCLGQGKQPQQAFQALFVILGLILGKRGYQRAMKKKLSPVGLILASAVLGVIVYGG